MARKWSVTAVLLAALALASGARVPLQAATTTTADVVFIMEAAQATFTNATKLALNGLSGSAQSYAAGAKTGIYPIQNFTDGSASSQYVDSNGQWLSNPQAVMYGVDQTGAVTTVLLTLSNPTVPQQPAGTVTNNNNNNNNGGSTTTNNNNNGPPQLTFTVALVPAQASAVKYQNGVVAQKITEASNGAGNLTTSITPGAMFSPVVIYIDQNQQGLPQKATTKWGWGGGGWGNDWNNGYYNNGWGNSGYSSNNNNNNNNNNGGWGGNNNNNNNNNNGGWGANNNNNNNNNNGGWGSSNNNNNNNNNGGWGSNNNNNNNNNGK